MIAFDGRKKPAFFDLQRIYKATAADRLRRRRRRRGRDRGRDGGLRYHRRPPMATKTDTTKLDITPASAAPRAPRAACAARARSPASSTAAARIRVPFAVDARELRHALAGAGAVLDLALDGESAARPCSRTPSVHPVRGEIMHVDLLRVDLNEAIHATVPSS